jgi:DDE domain
MIEGNDRAGVSMGLGNCFKGRQFTGEAILWAVRWYLMFPVSYRDLELMLLDRGVEVDHTTIFRWIQAYAAELEKRTRPHWRMSNGSWRVDETYVRVKGRWTYLYRAVDSRGQTIDFLLAARRDTAAAKRFFRKAMAQPHVRQSANPHRRQESCLSHSGRRYEKRRSAIAPHLSAAMQIPQQHRRARPPAYQAPCPAWARLRQFPYRAANFGGF